MLMPNRNGHLIDDNEALAQNKPLAQNEPTLWDTFKHVYDFILRAVNGDKGRAEAVFQDYLAGKLSEELLSISRRYVRADQAQGRDALEAVRHKRRRVRQRKAKSRPRSVIRQPSTGALQATNSS
jgi:hypothetical protein